MSKRTLSLADEKEQSGDLEHTLSTGLSADVPCRLSGFEAIPMAPLLPPPPPIPTILLWVPHLRGVRMRDS